MTCSTPPAEIARFFGLRSEKIFHGHCAEESPAWPAVTPLHRLIIQWRVVSLSKFRMLTRWVSCWNLQLQFEQCFTGSKIAPAFAAASFCGATLSQLVMVSFVRLFFLLALTIVCVFVPSVCTTFEIRLHCFSKLMRRIRVFSAFLTEVPCQTPLVLICHCKPLKRIIPPLLLSTCFVFVCWDPLQNYSTCAEGFCFGIVFFALFALRRLVDDSELGDVSVSLFAPLSVGPPLYLYLDNEVVIFSSSLLRRACK